MPFGVAVLTVSDTSFRDASADKSGPYIRETLSLQGYAIQAHAIVPDDLSAIQNVINGWCAADNIDWIVTTGGTGFGVRDVTPEAVRALLQREAPGLVHILLSLSLQQTPLAALSRPVAGTIRNTLIITLPGSLKAVKENIGALISAGIINHALELVRGGDGKQVHDELASSALTTTTISSSNSIRSHHHHHHHHHDHSTPTPRTPLSHDPSLPPSVRNRISPYPMKSFEEAISLVLQECPVNEIVSAKVNPRLKGCILAEDIYAPHSIPSGLTTNVDGYAVRSTDKPAVYSVVTSKYLDLTTPLPIGTIYRINTGAPLPAGADSVVMVEDTRLVSTFNAAMDKGLEADEIEVEILAQVSAGENVRRPGSDVKEGDLVLAKSELIGAGGGELGTLAFVERREVLVYKKPKVAIMSTGNELVDFVNSISSETRLKKSDWSGVIDINRPSLQAALEGMGYEVVDLGIVHDQVTEHVNTLKAGFEQADIVITTGGTSMGVSDLLKPIIERHLNGTIHFGRVKAKPGKPTTFATIPIPDDQIKPGGPRVKPIFALPGNPASALVMFYLFVVPALRKMGGRALECCQLPRIQVQLISSIPLDTRAEFHRVIVRSGAQGLKAFSTGDQRSSRVMSLSGANAFLALPIKEEGGPSELIAGEVCDAILIGELQMY